MTALPAAAIERIPKVELHVHLDGSFSTEYLFSLAKAKHDQLPEQTAAAVAACGDDHAQFRELVTCAVEERSLQAMLDKFNFFFPFVQGDMAAIEELSRLFVKSQAAQNVIYTEVRYAPILLTKAGFSSADDPAASKEVITAVTRGLTRGCAEYPGTRVAQILCMVDGKPEWADSLASAAGELVHPSDKPLWNDGTNSGSNGVDGLAADLLQVPILGVDVACGEGYLQEACQPSDKRGPNGTAHMAAFCRCAALPGLGRTCHAGESGPAAHVAAAAGSSYAGVRRIGHGYQVVAEANAKLSGEKMNEPAEFAAALKTLDIPDGLCFECCPTSSKATGGWTGDDWKQHPIKQLLQLRAAATAAQDASALSLLPRPTLSSDDPEVFGSSLSEEVGIAVHKMGINVDDIRQLMENACDASFLPPEPKAALRARFEKEWAVWQQQHA